MIERMPKGWPYKRLKSRDSGDNFILAYGVFAAVVMVAAMALAAMGAW